MEITRRTDYAIRMLLELTRSGGGPLSVRQLAERQGVPYAFARAVQRDLLEHEFITTVRGARGGAVLAKNPAEVSLLDVVTAIQGVPSVAVCAHDPSWCGYAGSCTVHRVWCETDEMLRNHLGSKTLAGLIADERK